MDARTHCGQPTFWRPEGSPRNDCFVDGSSRPGLPRQRQMGGSLPFEFVGRPPTGAVCLEGKADQSPGGRFLANLSASLGHNNVDFHQGDGHHQQSSLGGSWEEGCTQVGGRGGSTESQKKAAFSKEAKAGRMIYGGVESSSQTCMLRRGALCSETRSCQEPPVPSTLLVAKTSHGEGDGHQSYWNSLQTFSFVRWCSSLLGDVLATSTPFASFVRSTLHATRSTVQAPEKALFPLPFPKLGIFTPLPHRCSSRMRRKFGFDRAFHVVIAALNFLYADCTFPPLEMLVRKPSIGQRKALWNLRSLFKAFGSSDEDFSVPKSGRRSTNLLASLCDLSEFLTRSGAASEAYRRGFDGEINQGVAGQCLAPDLSRADELVPYRQLDPQRIRLSGSANWGPAPFLCDDLLLPFLEPQILVGNAAFNYEDLPNLEREDPNDIVALSRIWDVNGLLYLRPDVVSPDLRASCLRCFNCFKDVGQDRLIGDRRGRNQLESSVPGPSRFLPCGPALCVLEVPRGKTAVVSASDRKDFYHQLRVPATRARTNALWPPLPVKLLQSTKAYDVLCDQIQSRKKLSREEKGDDLGGLVLGLPAASSTSVPKKLTDDTLVHACFNTVAQGDHLGVEIATDSHRNLLKSKGLLVAEEELVSSAPFGGLSSLQGLVIDDYFSVSVEALDFKPGTSVSFRNFSVASKIYDDAGLVGSPAKDVKEEQKAKVAGAEIDSSSTARGHGVVTVGAPVQKRISLSKVSLELAKLRFTTDSLHACLVGGWTSSLMFRRPLMSSLFHSHKLFDASRLDSSHPQVLDLPPPVAQELVLLSLLAPFMCSDLSVPFGSKAFCTDSSDSKGAFVSTPVEEKIARSSGGLDRRRVVTPGSFQNMKPFFVDFHLILNLEDMMPKESLALHPRRSPHSSDLTLLKFAEERQKFPRSWQSLAGQLDLVWTLTHHLTLILHRWTFYAGSFSCWNPIALMGFWCNHLALRSRLLNILHFVHTPFQGGIIQLRGEHCLAPCLH